MNAIQITPTGGTTSGGTDTPSADGLTRYVPPTTSANKTAMPGKAVRPVLIGGSA